MIDIEPIKFIEFGNRLKIISSGIRKSAGEIADLIAIQRPNYYNAEAGKRGLPDKHLKKITELWPEVSYEWLKLGRGNPPEFNSPGSAKSIPKDDFSIEVSNTIKERIIYLRTQQDITHSELQRMSGVARSGIIALEREDDRIPRIDTVKAVAKALGTTVGYLLGETDQIIPQPQNLLQHNNVDKSYSNFSPKPVYSIMPKVPPEPDELEKVIGYLDLIEFNFKKCVEYLKVRDNSMQGETAQSYPEGCIIGLEPVPKDVAIVFGKPYLIKMNNGEIYFRLVRSGFDPAEYILQAINERRYDNLPIKITDIKAIFKARGPITIKDEHY